MPATAAPTSGAVRRGTSTQQDLVFTGAISGQMTSAVTQCVVLKKADPDGVSDVFQAIIAGDVGGSSHSVRIVLQKFNGTGAYESAGGVVRAAAIIDASDGAAAKVNVDAGGKSGTIDADTADGGHLSGSWSCSSVVTTG